MISHPSGRTASCKPANSEHLQSDSGIEDTKAQARTNRMDAIDGIMVKSLKVNTILPAEYPPITVKRIFK